ncbi:nose resistant to fluoxetine protein 6, partial [Trichonephila clavata]
MSLGDFDECINVRLGKMGKIPAPGEREYFHGKYCTVECRLPKGILDAIDEYESATPERRHNTSIGTSKTFLSMLLKYGQYMKVAAFRFGVCIPSTCDVEDLSSITTTIAKQVGFPLKVLHCQEKRSIEFRSEQTVITGFLITFIRWRKPIDTPKINLPKLIMKPYIRMTFFQLLVIALFLMIPLFGNGPFWGDFVGPYLQSCRDRWWLNLFYIQNYWQSDDTCLYHTWLLAAIMQLYIVAIVVVWFLIKKPNIGFILIITIVICGMAGVGAVVFIHKLPGALSMYLLDGVSGPQMWNTLFIKTFDHVGSFSIGLVTGYIVAKHKNSFNFGK